MWSNKTIRRALGATAVVVTALSLVAVPTLAGAASATKAKDPYLAADTSLNTAATIGGAGSTFAAPLENAAQSVYSARTSNASIDGYQAVGSGSGESDIINKVVDWGGTDVPMAQKDISKYEPAGANYRLSDFLQVPIGLGGVALSYNISGLHGKTVTLSAAVIAQIYKGKITEWNASVIKRLNPKVKLPHNKIIVVARADSSGTTFIFTNFLHTATPGQWGTLASKTPLTLPSGGIAGSGNAGVASDVQHTANSIGYVEYSYVLLNRNLKVAAIINHAGKAVTPSVAGIAAAAAARPNVTPTAFSIVWESGKKTYPIAGYTWAVIWKVNATSHAEGTLLVKYLDWLSHSGAVDGTTAGQDVAAMQGYVPLPSKIEALARTTLLKAVGSNGQRLLTTNGK
jgi:phosphate transport system substrate-binding protein